MSAAVSVSTSRPYGVKRVCAVWGVARSTFYAAPIDIEPARRGPAPAVCMVWARLRVSGVRVSRRRVTAPHA